MIKYIHYLFIAMISAIGLISCADDKDYGSTGEETLILNAINIEKTDYELKDGTICVEYGQSIALKFSIIPENADDPNIIWSSSDETIVNVDVNGVITAGKQEGTAIIYAKPAIGFGAAAATPSLTFKVIEKAILVEKLTLATDHAEDEANNNELLAGEVRQMIITAEPENHTYERYTWSSSNPEVATVDDKGFVTTVSEGNVTIKVVSRDEKGANAEYSFKVLPSILPEKVEFINTEKLFNMAYGESVNLKELVKLTPENATFALIQWETSDSNILTVDNKGVMSVKLSGDPKVMAMSGHDLILTASYQGEDLGNTSVKIEAAHFIQEFKGNTGLFAFKQQDGTGFAVSFPNNEYMHVDMPFKSPNYRQDFAIAQNADKNNPILVDGKKYKYIALKLRRPYYYNTETGTYSRRSPGGSGNKLALNFTAISGSNAGHLENFKVLDMSTGILGNEVWNAQPKIYVWKIDDNAKCTETMDSETGLIKVYALSFIIADVKEELEHTYDMYWFGSFDSVEAIKKFEESNE